MKEEEYSIYYCFLGQIVWRHVLEKADHGEIQFMGSDGDDIVTVSGRNIFVVRTWDPHGGFLKSEWTAAQPLIRR